MQDIVNEIISSVDLEQYNKGRDSEETKVILSYMIEALYYMNNYDNNSVEVC